MRHVEGASVINLSLGGLADADDHFMADAVNEARTFNAVVVAAAGNDGTNNDTTPVTPCALPADNLICVTAVNQSGGMPSFANIGADHRRRRRARGRRAQHQDRLRAAVRGRLRRRAREVDALRAGQRGRLGNRGRQGERQPGQMSTTRRTRYSELHAAANVNLSGERGCRLHFDASFAMAATDWFLAGAFDQSNQSVVDGLKFTGSSAASARSRWG